MGLVGIELDGEKNKGGYPFVGVSKTGEVVVLFYKESCGIVFRDFKGVYGEGYHDFGWKMSYFARTPCKLEFD